jgi:hypothetical protein
VTRDIILMLGDGCHRVSLADADAAALLNSPKTHQVPHRGYSIPVVTFDAGG